jgi:UDP-glucose 4-epimerase
MMKKILLVGGAGFLGTNLTQTLHAKGFQVGILDRSTPPANSPASEVFTGDLRDQDLVKVAFRDYRRFIYLAHEASMAPSAEASSESFVGNISLFVSLIEAAARTGVDEFTLFSSGGAVYGPQDTMPIPESTPTNPISVYGAAKLAMEKYLSVAATQHGFRHLIVRPSNPYGPGQNFLSPQGIVAVALANVARHKTLTIRGDGRATKDYFFVSDLAGAISCLLQTPAAIGPYNIGSGVGTKLLTLIEEIEQVVGCTAKIEFLPAHPADVQANVLGISLISQVTGWAPTVTLKDGLVKTWHWLRTQPTFTDLPPST